MPPLRAHGSHRARLTAGLRIDAPIDLVWRAWTEPDVLRRWLAPADAMESTPPTFPLLAWPDQPGKAPIGRVVGMDSPGRLDLEWTGAGPDYAELFESPHAPTRVEVRLCRRDAATVVTVEQRETREGSSWAAYEEIVADDWEEALVKLKAHCET